MRKNPVYEIKVEHLDDLGQYKTLVAFTWSGMEETGVARAKTEAPKFGIKPLRVWAELQGEVA